MTRQPLEMTPGAVREFLRMFPSNQKAGAERWLHLKVEKGDFKLVDQVVPSCKA